MPPRTDEPEEFPHFFAPMKIFTKAQKASTVIKRTVSSGHTHALTHTYTHTHIHLHTHTHTYTHIHTHTHIHPHTRNTYTRHGSHFDSQRACFVIEEWA
ncbi:hypothetical protein LOAG_00552, partial [Loa loa]